MKKLNNCYLIELKNFGISALLNDEFNLAYLAIVSDDFTSDIDALLACDSVIDTFKKINNNIQIENKFNPLHFPSIDKSFLMDEETIEKITEFHPYTAKTAKLSLNDEDVAHMRVISNPNINSITLQ